MTIAPTSLIIYDYPMKLKTKQNIFDKSMWRAKEVRQGKVGRTSTKIDEIELLQLLLF
jgi:hypothetical protein